MSLLGSIFGGEKHGKAKGKGKEESTEGLSDLFESPKELPERPRHEPKPRKSKRKDLDEKEQTEDAVTKKRKKPRKSKQEQKEGSGETETTESNETQNKSKDSPETVEDRTLFVGNLPLQGTTRKSLAAMFKDCGAIVSTRIRSVPVKGIKLPPQRAGDQDLMKKVCVNTNLVDYENSAKDTVQGYVVFKDSASVAKALALNNQLVVDGRRIRVDRSSPTVDPSRSVFCGNLPYGADESSLQKHFVKGCDFEVDDVEGVRIVRDKETFQCKGFGYVLLKEKSMVPIALKLHESIYMNKPMRVLVCGKRFKNKKGQDSQKRKMASPNVDGTVTAPKETVSVGAFRRIIAKQQKDATDINKRKRGEKKKDTAAKKAGVGGLSKRAALDKKVEKRVKKLQKRMSKGMGKARR